MRPNDYAIRNLCCAETFSLVSGTSVLDVVKLFRWVLVENLLIINFILIKYK